MKRPLGLEEINRDDRCLMVLSGEHAGQVFDLPHTSMTIGRADEADILLGDSSVSRRHARLEWCDERTLRIIDLDSTNGTWVDGESISERVLCGGERIELGGGPALRFGFLDPEEHRFFRRLYQHATVDELTGACNRRAFFDHLSRELAWHRRHDRPLTLVLFDIDEFKTINDNFGHLAGDLVLRGVSALLEQHCRSEDLVARVGGDEMACLLRETATQAGLVVAERARRAIERHVFGPSDRVTFMTSVSVGLTTKKGSELTTAEAFIDAADKALYSAKEAGRNRVGFAERERVSIL